MKLWISRIDLKRVIICGSPFLSNSDWAPTEDSMCSVNWCWIDSCCSIEKSGSAPTEDSMCSVNWCWSRSFSIEVVWIGSSFSIEVAWIHSSFSIGVAWIDSSSSIDVEITWKQKCSRGSRKHSSYHLLLSNWEINTYHIIIFYHG